MQQFFGLVNSLLARCESTARRGLKMITYKVWLWKLDITYPAACTEKPLSPVPSAWLRSCRRPARARGVNQVVPFTPAAGLLAWVENTIPLNNYLVGENRLSGAHLRYKRTGDYSFGQCWQQDAANRRSQQDAAAGTVCAIRLQCLLHTLHTATVALQ